jgi:DNA-binding CsgD family transcriptional regulator
MAGSHIAHAQLTAFSNCLHRIYGEPAGENPIDCILDALQELMRINSLAVDELKADRGRIVRHDHVTSRGFEGHPEVKVIPRLVAKDHPMIQHFMRTGKREALRLSDLVSERQMRRLSLYDYNSKVHEWRDQVSLPALVAGGTLNIALNRDRKFTGEEFFMLELLLPHIKRVINRCALFTRVPGNEQLTAREREVLFWITQGKRDEEIAFLIKSKPRTVNKHVGAILTKLGVENRASAVAAVLAGIEH